MTGVSSSLKHARSNQLNGSLDSLAGSSRVMRDKEPIDEEILQRMLLFCAQCMDNDGPVYAPIFERLERELTLHRTTNVLQRARNMPADEMYPKTPQRPTRPTIRLT